MKSQENIAKKLKKVKELCKMVVVTIYSYPCKGMNRQVFFDFSFLWYAKKSVYLTHLKSGCILFLGYCL